jgi:hypothetical protein
MTDPSVRGEIQATITEKIQISESVSYIVRDKDGNIKQQSNTKENKEEHAKPSEGTIKTKWFLKIILREKYQIFATACWKR